MSSIFSWFVKITGWIPYLIMNRPKFYYENKKLQSRRIRGKAIVMPNHHTVWDVGVMMHTFPLRNLHCVVAELMYEKNKFMRFFLNGIGAIRVDRNDGDFGFLDKASRILEKGGVVEIYPEARVPKKGEQIPLPFKPSVTYLALSTDTPIIPVVTNGYCLNKKRLRVLIGAPIDVKELIEDGLDEKKAIEVATIKLQVKIKEMYEELKSKEKK